ncbi:MAG: hypothetical protein ACXACO_05790 [Promethearchaeota archaeon]|jgi:hypothetical protein
MSKVGLSLSMIGGILFFILMYTFARYYYSMWKLDLESVLFFYFFLLANGGAIVGAILGFIDKSWLKLKLLKIGRILCFLAGLSYPLFLLIFYVLYNPFPLTFAKFWEDFINRFFIDIPELILFIGGITGIIEWRLELRKNKFAQE